MKLNILPFLIILVSCVEKELPITPHEAGEVVMSEAIMGDGYENQLYFSLEKNEVITSNLMTDWDIAFRSDLSGPQMILNSGRFMKIGAFESLELDSVEWKHESSDGAFYETALGNIVGSIVDSTDLLVIDLGYDLDNSALGYVEFQIDSISDSGYYFSFGEIGSEKQSAYVERDFTREWNHFSFINNEPFEVEPSRGEWDLYFTRYTEYLNGETYYLVTGVLGTPEGLTVIDSVNLGFEDLMNNDWNTFSFNDSWGAIGYDWKWYDFDTNEYLIDTDRYFGVRTAEGKEFVLRFIDFYDDLGNKGSIKLEVAER